MAHLAVVPGGGFQPAGGLFLVDVARESADQLIDELRRLHVDRDGGIAMEAVAAAVSRPGEEAERRAPGEGSNAAVWEEVVRTAAADAALSASYLPFPKPVNLLGILVAALCTLALQRAVWHRVPRIIPRVQRVGRARL